MAQTTTHGRHGSLIVAKEPRGFWKHDFTFKLHAEFSKEDHVEFWIRNEILIIIAKYYIYSHAVQKKKVTFWSTYILF